MGEGYNVFNILTKLAGFFTAGLVLYLLISGGGIALLFISIPWYVWLLILVLLIAFLFKK